MSNLNLFFCENCEVLVFKNQCYKCKKKNLQASEDTFLKISFAANSEGDIDLNIQRGDRIFNIE